VAGLGLEQMEESLLEGNKESSLLLWSSSTRGKDQSLPSLGRRQPSMMLVPLAFRQRMTLYLVKVISLVDVHRQETHVVAEIHF
jgi:hypothetical protein